MKKLSILIALFSMSAFADFKLGTYTGTDAQNEACSITFEGKIYRHNVHHPFNEVVNASIDGVNLELKHPGSFNFETSEVQVDHSKLVDTSVGRNENGMYIQYAEVTMVHSPNYNGPSSYRSAIAGISTVCSNLSFNE
jgi:hypothetical protein